MKKLSLLFLVLTLLDYSSSAQAPKRVWKSIYTDSSADQLHINDAVVDSNGNSYLVGYRVLAGDEYYQTHLFIQKINAAGGQEWIKYFNNKLDSIDVANAVGLDADGNIYVAGARIDTFCNICTNPSKISDIIVMKYKSSGKRSWTNRYHDADYLLASPSDIAVLADGTVIVTGSDGDQALVEKIKNNGGTLWIKNYDNVVANTVCVDNNNNTYIGGASDPDHLFQTQKPMVMRLKNGGDVTWTSVFDEPGENGRIYFVSCDSLNNIYANGQTDTIAFDNNPKIITIKYNNKGKQQWFRKEEDHSTTQPHYYGDFKLDADGNFYLTGFVSLSGTNDDWLVTKYNSSGDRQWKSYFDDTAHGSDKPIALIADKRKNVYVAGYSFAYSGNYAMTMVIYDSTGKQLGFDVFKVGNRSNSFGAGIGLDKTGYVYVSGDLGIFNSPYPSSVVIKYGVTHPTIAFNKSSPVVVNDIKLFPNPVVNTVNIVFTTSMPSKNYALVIRDVSGNTVLVKQLNSSEKMINVNVGVQQLKPGIYTANISNGVNVASKTFIKE